MGIFASHRGFLTSDARTQNPDGHGKDWLPAAAALFGFGMAYAFAVVYVERGEAICRTEFEDCVFVHPGAIEGCLETYRSCSD